jgi:hypothetical protein
MTDLELLDKDLEEAALAREHALLTNKVSSWEEFKYVSGVVAGLRAAQQAVQRAQARYTED